MFPDTWYRSGQILWILSYPDQDLDPDPDLQYWFMGKKIFFSIFLYDEPVLCLISSIGGSKSVKYYQKSTVNALPLYFWHILIAVFLSRSLSKTL
jgi:hypothetical protein